MNRLIAVLLVVLVSACGSDASSTNADGSDDSNATAGAEHRSTQPPCSCQPASDPACQEMCAAQDALGASSLTNEDGER